MICICQIIVRFLLCLAACDTHTVQLTDEVITSLLDTNLKSVIYAFKYGLPAIKESGGKGSIVVNTSCMGSVVTANPGFQTGAVYAATKSAADTLVKYAVSATSCIY